jgi:hypothetical protein
VLDNYSSIISPYFCDSDQLITKQICRVLTKMYPIFVKFKMLSVLDGAFKILQEICLIY